jgi:hypothetical protein
MKYFLDCEFNGYRGELISLALVGEDGREMYLVTHRLPEPMNPWVKENVIPILFAEGTSPTSWRTDLFGPQIERFLLGDTYPVIVADWPDDIRYFCECLIVGPGEMVNIPRIRFDVERVDAYPTDLRGAVQHNALWDARALRLRMTGERSYHFDKWQPA